MRSAGGDGSSAPTPNDGDVGAGSSAQPPKQKEQRREQGARRAVSWWRWLFSQPRGGLGSGVSIALGWSAMVPERAPGLILAMPRGLPAVDGCTEQHDTDP